MIAIAVLVESANDGSLRVPCLGWLRCCGRNCEQLNLFAGDDRDGGVCYVRSLVVVRVEEKDAAWPAPSIGPVSVILVTFNWPSADWSHLARMELPYAITKLPLLVLFVATL